MTNPNPVLADVWRGSAIESRHRGAVSVMDSSGREVLSVGDVKAAIFPRSAIKFLQAIPFVESGAVEHFNLTEQHVAIACASHNGEKVHVELVQSWLKAIACSDDDLECGASLPLQQAAQFELKAEGCEPQRAHHNCSGKHLGLLSTCRQLNEPTVNYRLYEHAIQQRIFGVLGSLTDTRIADLPWGYDGCGIPNVAIPLQGVAQAMARFADGAGQVGERRDAMARIRAAVTAHPYLVAGKERLCTDLMQLMAPSVLVKTGAEGVFTACIPEKGLGITLKMDDGNVRGAQAALGVTLQKLGVLSDDMARELAKHIAPELNNSRGEAVGRIAPSSHWDTVSVT